ncbi:MAG: hypothetical protein ACI87E_000554 [Mariniblastus sp.]|jgi:hypothetical protein
MTYDSSNPRSNEPAFDSNDLDWLAFCYIADELDVDQRTAFERRLETDEQAQNSLVGAMRASELVYATLDSTSSDDVKSGSISVAPRANLIPSTHRRVYWLAGMSAAVVFLAWGWNWYPAPDSSESAPVAVAMANPDHLASAWVDTVLSDTGTDLEALAHEDADSDEFLGEEEDWMFVALTDLEDSTETPADEREDDDEGF